MCIEKTSICRIHLKIKSENKTIVVSVLPNRNQAWQNVKFEVTRFDLTHVLLVKKALEDRQKDKKSSMEEETSAVAHHYSNIIVRF